MGMKSKLKEALSKSVKKEDKERLKKKALKKLSINENTKKAIGIGKALAEKKFKLRINKNIDMDIKLDKDEKRIGFKYKKRF